MARVDIRLPLLMPWMLLVSACASNEVLFAEYEEAFCAVDETPGVPVVVEKIVEKEVFRDKPVIKEVLAVARQLPWEPAVYFDTDLAKLNEASLQTLANNVAFLKKFPHYNVSIRGFTDKHASPQYNRQLSQRRTTAVLDHLKNAGVESKRLILHAHGESIALSDSHSAVADEISRRVEMILLDDYGRPAVTFQNLSPGSER